MSDLAALQQELREAEDEINSKSRDVGRLKTEYTRNLNKIVESFWPRTAPLQTAIFQSTEEQKSLEIRIGWLEKKVLAMEKYKSNFFELRDMAAARKELIDTLAPNFQDAYLSLEGVKREELAVLRSYENPPQLVLDTFATVCFLRDDPDSSWDAARVMLSETYYYAFFVSKAKSAHKMEITEEKMDELNRYLMAPESAPEYVAQVSAPLGAIAKWLRVLRDFFFIQSVTEPKTGQTLTEVKEELLELRKRLQSRKDDISGSDEKLSILETEMKEALEELRDRYDETMVPLQNLFFDANQKFNTIYSSPQRERSE